MRKVLLLLFLGIVLGVFLLGCDAKRNDINISVDDNMPNETLSKINEKFNFKYLIANPLESTFVGKITYNYDNKCIYPVGNSEDTIEIKPKEKKGVIKEFS